MRHLDLHAAGALITLLALLCLLAAAGVVALLESVFAIPAGLLAGAATFQALRVPVGRTAGRLLER